MESDQTSLVPQLNVSPVNEFIENDIQGAVLHSYLSEKQNQDSDKLLSSSDTVNELLQGLTSTSNDQNLSIDRLMEETADVLPTFSKALDNSNKHEGEFSTLIFPIDGVFALTV